MSRFFKRRDEVLGKKPGELIYIGKHASTIFKGRVIRYTSYSYEEQDYQDPNQLIKEASSGNQWINIEGIADILAMSSLKSKINIDGLIVADIMNTGTRPVIQRSGDSLLIVVKMLHHDEDAKRISSEQLSMLLSDRRLITFQEAPGDVFDSVRNRLKDESSILRNSDIGYLAYSLMDAMVDNYMMIMQSLAEEIESLEEQMLDHPHKDTIEEIIFHRKELLYLRKTIPPFKEVLRELITDQQTFFKGSEKHLDDLYSNLMHVVETVEIYREITAQLQSSYDSYMNNRLNEIMKLLTIFSVIFLPLSLITGIYGTNFDHIPELHFPFGYLYLWGVLILIVFIMVIAFKRKKWF